MGQIIRDWWEDKSWFQRILGTIFLLVIAMIIVLIIYFFLWINPAASDADAMNLIHPVNLALG
ncbi:hypothetical protein KJ969_01465 [Patescibacteria group bacterium]|nr:hypothetical protein [Patescibacteria group bacterium]MBU1921786.1 hypothetical protein [Patescibacteria group bacterium]